MRLILCALALLFSVLVFEYSADATSDTDGAWRASMVENEAGLTAELEAMEEWLGFIPDGRVEVTDEEAVTFGQCMYWNGSTELYECRNTPVGDCNMWIDSLGVTVLIQRDCDDCVKAYFTNEPMTGTMYIVWVDC